MTFKELCSQYKRLISLLAILVIGIITFNVVVLGFSEQQTFYFHILCVGMWLGTSAVGMWLYNIWSLPKYLVEGDDASKNQVERLSVLKVHAAIIIASAILVFGSVWVYFGKASDESFGDNATTSGEQLSSTE